MRGSDPAVDPVRELIENEPRFNEFRRPLLDFRTREDSLPDAYQAKLEMAKNAAALAGIEVDAKVLWCLEQIGISQNLFVDAYEQLRIDEFFGGWCTLERCETTLSWLKRHYIPTGEQFGIRHMEAHVVRLQDLFPYKYFASPAFVVEEGKCSTCGRLITLKGGCDHDLGEIYGGYMCHRVITRAQFLELSIVKDPVQKYSAIVPQNANYGAIHYVIAGLRNAWSPWRYRRSEVPTEVLRYPESRHGESCPCGSKKPFEVCCFGVTYSKDHFDIQFAESPDAGFPQYLEDGSYFVVEQQ